MHLRKKRRRKLKSQKERAFFDERAEADL